jgi:flagellar biosynthetic protein FliR
MLQTLLTLDVLQPFLVFVRVGTILSMLPGFSAAYVSVRIRLLLALAISLLVVPVLGAQLPPPPVSAVGLGLLVLGESVIGLFIGSIVRVLLSVLHVAGTMTAYYASLASSMIQDPVAEQQSSTLSGFFTTLGLVLIFVTDAHHLMLRAIVDSYALFPAGSLPPFDDFASSLGRLVGESFLVAFQITAPFLIVGVGFQLGLGLLSRLMPQLPVFFFGLPMQIGLQIWVALLAISGIMLVFLNYFAESLLSLTAL